MRMLLCHNNVLLTFYMLSVKFTATKNGKASCQTTKIKLPAMVESETPELITLIAVQNDL